jgi:hypothetical protein
MEVTAGTLGLGRVTSRERLRRELAVAGAAGPVAGLIGGVLARIAMRGVALSAGADTGFTVGGTLNILMVGAVLGIVVALVHAVVRRVLPGPWFVPGLAIGIAPMILMVFLARGAVAEAGQDIGPLVALSGGVVIPGGLATNWVVARTRRRFEAEGWTEDGWPAVGFLISLGMLLILAVVVVANLAGAVAGAL